MSPMIARESDIRAPAPSPWIPRYSASVYIESASVHSREPNTKITMPMTKNGLRP